jgi:predicted PolB exonuclease-like 3'-5' exonuclease
MSSPSEVKYLVFDIESVADGETIAQVRYPKLDLEPAEAIKRFRQELLSDSGRDFIPYTFHIPIAVVVAKLREDFSLIDIVSLDQPDHRPHIITQHFWMGWERYHHPTWVTFNGRTFDIPLMELAAFRYGVAVPDWFNIHERTYSQNRNRYNIGSHLDLHELITNFGSTWFRGGLNLAAYLLGKPGKMDVQGDMVQDMYAEGKVAEINEYCRCDVLDTYFVLLRFMVLTGKLTLEREQELTAQTKATLEAESEQHPAYKTYLDAWQEWPNPFKT